MHCYCQNFDDLENDHSRSLMIALWTIHARFHAIFPNHIKCSDIVILRALKIHGVKDRARSPSLTTRNTSIFANWHKVTNWYMETKTVKLRDTLLWRERRSNWETHCFGSWHNSKSIWTFKPHRSFQYKIPPWHNRKKKKMKTKKTHSTIFQEA